MPQNITLYNLLISCPGDVKKEIEIIKSAVEDFNQLYSESLGITIQTKHWSKNSYAQSGGKPQSLLNEQFVNKCDAAVAIFWTRFGTPTDEYGSGTEEEIEIMLQSGKQVFMYFSDMPVSPSAMDSDGYKKIQAFRDKYKDRGVYFTYSSEEQFKNLFFAHLSMHFLYEKKKKEVDVERKPDLRLMGIAEDGTLSDCASIYDFALNTDISTQEYSDNINSLFNEIANIKVDKRIPSHKEILLGISNAKKIDKKVQENIEFIAKSYKLKLSDDFFDLGSLSEGVFSSSTLYNHNMQGTAEEKNKYTKINQLHNMLIEALVWTSIEMSFKHKKCIRLALQNNGTAIDEDIEIAFEIPKASFLTLPEFPNLDNNAMKYMVTKCDISSMFGINSTTEYNDYDSAIKAHTPNFTPQPVEMFGFTPDYSDNFHQELEDVFCYSVYEKDDCYSIKLKMDYIKHHTTVAFPSIIFIKEPFSSIKYTITSKHLPDIISGEVQIV